MPEKLDKSENLSSKTIPRLRTVEEIAEAHEELFARQQQGKIDPKTADAMNTTLKGIVYLNVKLKMDLFKTVVMAQKGKIEIPQKLLAALPIAIE